MKNKIISFLILTGLFSQTGLSQSIDSYIKDSSLNVFTLVANSANSVSSPVDLDFYPNQVSRPYQLWVLNQGTASTGGSTVIISNANQVSRTFKYVKDGNAWHFMSMASGIAFGDSFWATSADILDANHSTGKYTGPTLWPSDLSIYGIVGNPSNATFNGSHLDMIHQSPYGKGIAFERDLVYWVLDGYEGNLKRYDYVQPHQPGGADHSAGAVIVCTNFKFTKHSTLPSHIVMDSDKKYLYGCDPVGKRIFRVDITSGVDIGSGSKVNFEALASYENYDSFKIKDIVNTGLVAPVGIDVYGDRLVVTDNGSDEIIIYNISDNYSEVGRIKLKYTTSPDPMGVKIGPDGVIYFVDKANRRVYKIDNNKVWPLNVRDNSNSDIVNVYPNPSASSFTIQSDMDLREAEIQILSLTGQLIPFTIDQTNHVFEISTLENGVYILLIKTQQHIYTKKIIKQ